MKQKSLGKTVLGIRVLRQIFLFITLIFPLFLFGESEVFYIKDSNYTIETISQLSQDTLKQYNHKKTDFGYTKESYWVIVHLKNSTSEKRDKFIALDPTLDDVKVYEQYNNAFKMFQYGDLIENSQSVRYYQTLHETSLPPQTQKNIYIKIHPILSKVNISTTISDKEGYFENNLPHLIALLFFYAAISAILLYNFLIFIGLKKKIFVYYLLFHISQATVYATMNGVGNWLIWSGNVFINTHVLLTFGALSAIGIILFATKFIEIPLNKVYKTLIALYMFIILLSYINPYFANYELIDIGLNLVMMAILLPHIILYAFKKRIKAYYFLAGWSLYIVGVVLSHLNDFEILEESFFTHYTLQIGTLFEMIFLSLVLIKTYIDLQQENIKKERKINRLYYQTLLDPLTKIYNRHGLFEHYHKNLLRNSEIEFAIMMIDIDDFKQINDTHGHDIGDKVLRRFSNILQDKVTQNDIIARYGGEEFIIIRRCDDIKAFSEGLLKSVREGQITADEHVIYFTISIGSTEINKSFTLDENIKKADTAMYQAKNSGKDKVVFV